MRPINRSTRWREQAIKALTGENSLDTSIVNSMMPKYREKTEQDAKVIMEQEKEQSKEAGREIGDLVSWAEAFDEADSETRKMIIARLVERIDIGADYSISIRFRISIERLPQVMCEPCRSFVFYASFLRAKIICHTMVNKA